MKDTYGPDGSGQCRRGARCIAFVPSEMIEVVAALANPLLHEPLTEKTVRQILHDVDALNQTNH